MGDCPKDPRVANLEKFNYRKGFGSIHALFVTPVGLHTTKGKRIVFWGKYL